MLIFFDLSLPQRIFFHTNEKITIEIFSRNLSLIFPLKLASEVGRAFQPDKMAASVADPGSFGHREMTALLS
jgi:hypothetical protein